MSVPDSSLPPRSPADDDIWLERALRAAPPAPITDDGFTESVLARLPAVASHRAPHPHQVWRRRALIGLAAVVGSGLALALGGPELGEALAKGAHGWLAWTGDPAADSVAGRTLQLAALLVLVGFVGLGWRRWWTLRGWMLALRRGLTSALAAAWHAPFGRMPRRAA